MAIPFVDLTAQYASIREPIDAAMEAVLRDTAFIGGPYVTTFESGFATFCQVDHVVGVSSGTDALRLALLACGVGPGDEVLTVPNTFIATAEAITSIGARVRFVDVSPHTRNMDPSGIAAAITPRTKAIIPVHLYGRPADMDPIREIAHEHRLKVIGDAAQAHGAAYKGQPIATLGDAVCFSFYPGKNLGAYGDAGAVATNDAELADRVRLLSNHGRRARNEHLIEGLCHRLDGLQASILSAKIPYLAGWNEQRRHHAAHYRELLNDASAVTLPAPDDHPETQQVFHLYAVQSHLRDAIYGALRQAGIGCGLHYPTPIHMQPAFAHLGLGAGSFPVAERLCRETLSLPMFPELTIAQIESIAGVVREALA